MEMKWKSNGNSGRSRDPCRTSTSPPCATRHRRMSRRCCRHLRQLHHFRRLSPCRNQRYVSFAFAPLFRVSLCVVAWWQL